MLDPDRIETEFNYEWSQADKYLKRANGDKRQAFENLKTVLSVTPAGSPANSVLRNIGCWMLLHWRDEIFRKGPGQAGEATNSEKKTA